MKNVVIQMIKNVDNSESLEHMLRSLGIETLGVICKAFPKEQENVTTELYHLAYSI